MKTHDCGSVYPMKVFLLTISWLLLVLHVLAFAGESQPIGQKQWMGPDGQLLPFSTADEVCEFLRTAEIQGMQRIPTGLTKPKKLLLEKDGTKANAIFHSFRREKRQMKLGRELVSHYRDSYLNQVAAYEMSRLLGMTNVPPTVLREISGRKGSVQLWIENGRTEKKRREEKIELENLSAINLCTYDMWVFDYLINNIDRHLDNILYDPDWQLWLIDHTRAFGRDPGLLVKGKLRRCSRSMWTKLQSLDDQVISQTLEPYMGRKEINALLSRRKEIVSRLKEKIRKEGETKVLFDYENP
ncbi:MAG: hypothetical protein V3S89_14410 [Desulfobacterales bacterium]